ncbi:hypothetical protein P3T73_03365 [Kiritimatiellota bacterium B12222]|nr:hypothetical protein P3T73_03365 [Kiritimatiellota bacterium B12222]
MTAAKTTPAKRKSTAKKSPQKRKTKSKAKQETIPKRFKGNPYREGSNYALCFDYLASMGLKKPVTRKDLLEAYSKGSGKDPKRARYDMAVITSPTKNGDGHQSSKKFAYWVERLENSAVRLHMADNEEVA